MAWSTPESFSVTVPNIHNWPPRINAIGNLTAIVGKTFSHYVNAHDLENDTITYGLAEAPAGATIDNSTGVITWTPNPTHIGMHNFTVSATGGGASNKMTFFVMVKNP